MRAPHQDALAERAGAEQDEFCRLLAANGVAVLHLGDLLADVLRDARVRGQVIARTLAAEDCAPSVGERLRRWLHRLDLAAPSNALLDVADPDVTVLVELCDSLPMATLLPPLASNGPPWSPEQMAAVPPLAESRAQNMPQAPHPPDRDRGGLTAAAAADGPPLRGVESRATLKELRDSPDD